MHEAVMLAELLRANQPCVALTGAGISTESGIPDFRSASRDWARFEPLGGVSIDGFRRHPERAWQSYGRRLEVLAGAGPNRGHLALAKLEAAGLLSAVVTQNVDGLHQRAGSRNVIEVHGSIATASCPACGQAEPRERLMKLLPLPRCRRCHAILRPDVVMFGELLPAKAVDRATRLAREAGLLLVVGSSLQVWPVAGLPEETLAAGGMLAVVNRDETPYDHRATLVAHASAGRVLAEAARLATSAA